MARFSQVRLPGRKVIIGAALAASALGIAAPAAAQWNPQSRPYGQQQPYGYNQPGYGNGYGQGRALMARVDQVRQRIQFLSQRNMLSGREAYRLDAEAQQLRQRVRQLSYNGINQNERYDVERRIARLEQMVRMNANDRDGRFDGGNDQYRNGQYGNGQYDNRDGRWQGDRGQGDTGQNGRAQDGRWQDRDGNWHDRDDRR